MNSFVCFVSSLTGVDFDDTVCASYRVTARFLIVTFQFPTENTPSDQKYPDTYSKL
jgi:hypothetical protein